MFKYKPEWQGPLSGPSFEKQTEDFLNGIESRVDEIDTRQTPSDATPMSPSVGSAGTSDEYSRGDHSHPLQSTVSGNAGTADALRTARQIALSNEGSGAASFDGTADIAIPLTVSCTATGSTTKRTIASRFADIVNALDFGAVGDGVTDDTDALNGAMTAAEGKTLYIPAGTYLTSTGLRIPSDTTVFGAGWSATIIKLTSDDFATPCVTNAANIVGQETSNTGNWNIILRDICIDGNGYRANASGTSGSSGSAISWRNAHHVLVQNVMAVRGRLHCLDIASAKYDSYFDPDNGKDWRIGASSDVRVENFIGYDAARDDVITTHYSYRIQLVNCYVSAQNNSTRPFTLAESQCGIEIDDGSHNVEIRGCYATGFVRGLVAKAHNIGDPEEAALSAREVFFYDCVSSGNTINYQVTYHGALRPVGVIGFYNCTSIQPVEILAPSSEYPTSYFYFYGRANNLVIDGFICKGDPAKSSNYGLRFNSISSTFPEGLNCLDVSNLFFENVNVDTSGSSAGQALLRMTSYISSPVSIKNVVAINCGDVPVIYSATANFNDIRNIRCVAGSAYTSYVIRTSEGSITKEGCIKNVKHKNYAGVLRLGSYYVDTLSESEEIIGNSSTGILNYRSTEDAPVKRFRLSRAGSPLPNGSGTGIAFGRKDSLGDFDDVSIRQKVTAYATGESSICFGTRLADQSSITDRWEIANNGTLRPCDTKLYKVGDASHLPTEMFAQTGTINTSDVRLKTDINDISDAVLDAWGDVQWQEFKFKDSVAKKGDKARLHTGLVAQFVDGVFKQKGLDARDYGLLCYDEWDATYDENGNVTAEAGSQWSLRYEEALAMEAAYQRRRAERIESRLAALEAFVNDN